MYEPDTSDDSTDSEPTDFEPDYIDLDRHLKRTAIVALAAGALLWYLTDRFDTTNALRDDLDDVDDDDFIVGDRSLGIYRR